MALKAASLFLYNFQITANNSSIDFKTSSGGSVLQATLNQGFYSLSSLLTEIVRALQAADPVNTYTATADRTIGGGTQNRVTIATSTGSFLSLLFGSGPRSASSVASTIGFNATDYTGLLTYTGSASAGTSLIPNWTGKNYVSPLQSQKVFGQVNVSASGVKEAIVFAVQQFVQVQFMYIDSSTWNSQWEPFMAWAMQQREFEFTPEISDPSTFYEVTLEKTGADGKGLGFMAREMLSEGMPDLYDTGNLTFRLVPSAGQFA